MARAARAAAVAGQGDELRAAVVVLRHVGNVEGRVVIRRVGVEPGRVGLRRRQPLQAPLARGHAREREEGEDAVALAGDACA